ncbi:type II toxin-antitoxin system RelE/ParE family toxin [Azospirillum formosense]
MRCYAGAMDHVDFADERLRRLEEDPGYTAGFAANIVRGYRKAMQAIRAATDERDLCAMRGLRFEKLQGKRAHQHSMRLNDQWRLILELRSDARGKQVWIISIEDYH